MTEQDMAVPRYHFPPLERRGIGGMLRPGQVGLLVTGALTGIVALYAIPTLVGALVALVMVATCLFAGFWPIQGRTIEEWAGPWAKFRWAERTGVNAEVALGAELGIRRSDGAVPVAAPAALRDVEMLSFTLNGSPVGVVKDSKGYTTALKTTGPPFMLRDREEQEALLAGFGEFLAEFTLDGTAVQRLQLIERTVPDNGDEMAAYYREVRDPTLAQDSEIIQSYEELISSAAPAAQLHEVLVAMRVSGAPAGAIGAIGAGRVAGLVGAAFATLTLAFISLPVALVGLVGTAYLGLSTLGRIVKSAMVEDREACEAVARELPSLVSGLERRDIQVESVLGPRALAWTMRTAFDPKVLETPRPPEDDLGVSPANAWPVTSVSSTTWYRSDSGLHRTWKVREFPRRPMHADWLHPLLLETKARRSVSFILQPMSNTQSLREAERAVTSDEASEEARATRGFRSTARHRRQAGSAERREEELSSGHGDYSYAGFVTLTVPEGDGDLEALEKASKEMLRAAAQSHMDLSVQYGDQARAFTNTLPLCRGLG